MAIFRVSILNRIIAVFAVLNAATVMAATPSAPVTVIQAEKRRCAMQVKFDSLKKQLKAATASIAMEKYAAAIAILDPALVKLGDSYLSSNNDISDDTGTKILLAESEQRNGNLMLAANLKRNMLEARLELFERYHLKR
jgi:hypothetical protein